MSEQIITKRCSTCKTIKPVSHFYRNNTRGDGYAYRCKECQRLHRLGKGRKTFIKNRKSEKWLTYSKNYEKNRKRDKDKNTAKWKVEYAVRTNVLLHPKICKCWECGEQAQLYHHILGYKPSNWFDVIPLCTDCHYTIHRIISRRQERQAIA